MVRWKPIADFQNGGFGEFIIDTTTVSLNEWHHVALTIDPSKMTLYLDGILVEELVHNRGPGVKNHSYVAIGRHLYYDNPFRGLMDEIRIWGVALTEQEIRNSMYAQLSGNENGLVAYWNFNQGSGQIAHDSTSSSINGVLGLNTQIEIYDPSWVLSDRPTAPPTKPITIDIMPRKHHENINLHSHGEITVAILSASEFYASDIVDKDSLTFGRTGDEDSLAFCYYRPEDIHGDGLKKDLVCHFYTEDTGFQCGDTVGILKGTTKDGTPIQGSDSVKIIPCKKPCKK
jgi:hypothetical protein